MHFSLVSKSDCFFFPFVLLHGWWFIYISHINRLRIRVRRWCPPRTSVWKLSYFFMIFMFFILPLEFGYHVFFHVSCLPEIWLQLVVDWGIFYKLMQHWNLTSSVWYRWVCNLSPLLFLLSTTYFGTWYAYLNLKLYIDAHGLWFIDC
jgi:hypothetical protein